MTRPTAALIDLSALRANFLLAETLAPGGKNMPIIKANAYGHGAVEVARALEDVAPAFGVACVEEAVELRDAGIASPVLVLQGFFDRDELIVAAESGFWPVIQNDAQVRLLSQGKLPRPIVVWLAVDTGMRRLGYAPDRAVEVHDALRRIPGVEVQVLMSHLSCADDLENDYTRAQVEVFDRVASKVACGQSLAASGGIMGWPATRRHWNRPGYMLYGNSPFVGAGGPNAVASLRPVMTLISGVIALRDVRAGEAVGYGAAWTASRNSRIATVSIGYGDGYPRQARSGTPVLVRGHQCPLAGRVSMDMITVDVTDLPGVEIGDEVVLWGPGLPVDEVAQWADTIGYELLTRMPVRTPRRCLTPERDETTRTTSEPHLARPPCAEDTQ